MSDRHRSFLIIEECVFAGLIDIVIDGGFVWLSMRSEAAIPLRGDPCIGTDTLATGFLLPFITCSIVSPLVRRQVKAGKLPALEPDQIGLLDDLARPRARPDRRSGRGSGVGRRPARRQGSASPMCE